MKPVFIVTNAEGYPICAGEGGEGPLLLTSRDEAHEQAEAATHRLGEPHYVFKLEAVARPPEAAAASASEAEGEAA